MGANTSASSRLEPWAKFQEQQKSLRDQQRSLEEQQNKSFLELLQWGEGQSEAFQETRTHLAEVSLEHEKILAEKKKLEGTVKSLQSKLSNMEQDGQLVVTLIDGDGYIFARQYVSEGRAGGQAVAAVINQELIATFGRRTQLLAAIYLNRTGLSDVLALNGFLGKEANLDQFIVGFNQSSPLLSIVDVGAGKEAADTKIREMLRLYARLHQVKNIYFGGAHDGGYARELMSLRTEGLLDKVRLLVGNSQNSAEIDKLNLPRVTLGDIFHSQPLVNSSRNRPLTWSADPTPRITPNEPDLSKTLGRHLLPNSPILTLVNLLIELKAAAPDVSSFSKTTVSSRIRQRDPKFYDKHGVRDFKEYVQLAVAAGVIVQHDSEHIALAEGASFQRRYVLER